MTVVQLAPADKLHTGRLYLVSCLARSSNLATRGVTAAGRHVKLGSEIDAARRISDPRWTYRAGQTFTSYQDDVYSVAQLAGAIRADLGVPSTDLGVVVTELSQSSGAAWLDGLFGGDIDRAVAASGSAVSNVGGGVVATASGAGQILRSVGEGASTIGQTTSLAPGFFGVLIIGAGIWIAGRIYKVW